MEFQHLQVMVFDLLRSRQENKAEDLLKQTKDLFRGRGLGKWFHLYAQTLTRVCPEDREGFITACTHALRLLQGDQESLCSLYITQVRQAVVWREWHLARTGIRRLRSMIRRHSTEYGIQRLQGVVLLNEALIERIAGNFVRAVSLALLGIEAVVKYAYPTDPRIRSPIISMAYLEATDSYLRLGERTKALEVLSKVDPTEVSEREYPRYCYIQSRYWLALGIVHRAEYWADQIHSSLSWEPDWPTLLLELKAGIASAKGQVGLAERLLREAIEHASRTENHVLLSILREAITSLKGVHAP